MYRYTVRFTAEEHVRVLTMYEQAGVYGKAIFIKARVFDEGFKVMEVDKTLVDYYTQLFSFHAQFRGIGMNYNQTVTELKNYFSEKKVMALLYKLEKQTYAKSQNLHRLKKTQRKAFEYHKRIFQHIKT